MTALFVFLQIYMIAVSQYDRNNHSTCGDLSEVDYTENKG